MEHSRGEKSRRVVRQGSPAAGKVRGGVVATGSLVLSTLVVDYKL